MMSNGFHKWMKMKTIWCFEGNFGVEQVPMRLRWKKDFERAEIRHNMLLFETNFLYYAKKFSISSMDLHETDYLIVPFSKLVCY